MADLPILTIMLLILSIKAQQILTDGLTWKDARQRCGEDGLEYDKDSLVNSKIPDGEEFWFGMAIYMLRSPWIELLGCYTFNESLEITRTISIVMCQRKCNTSYFGYKDDGACFCFKNLTNRHDRVDPQRCIDGNLTDYFVFHEYTDSNLPSNGSNNCTTIYCSGGKNNIKAADCNYSSDNRSTICEHAIHHREWEKSFIISIENCIGRGHILLPPTICLENEYRDLGVEAWTNVFFEVMEEKLTNDEAGHRLPVKCIYAVLQRNNWQREVIEYTGNCSKPLPRYVCKNARVIVSGNNKSTDDKELLDVASLVGGVLGFVVLVIPIVVLVVCWKRSIGIFKKGNNPKGQSEFSNVTYASNAVGVKSNNDLKPTMNQSFEVATNNTNIEYAQVNKKGNAQRETQKADDTYIESGFGEYDKLNNIKNRKIQENESTYDSNEGFRDQNDPTYDISKSGVSSDKDNDVYDHSFQTESSNSDYGYSTSGMVYCTDKSDVYDRTF